VEEGGEEGGVAPEVELAEESAFALGGDDEVAEMMDVSMT
jgi:hypothetical protein